jgi:hypothetical protein
MTVARPEQITPELVLVCPELRTSLEAEYEAHGLPPRPGRGWTSLDVEAATTRTDTVDDHTTRAARAERLRPLLLGSAAYAAERLVFVAVRGAVIVGLLVLTILAATELARV